MALDNSTKAALGVLTELMSGLPETSTDVDKQRLGREVDRAAADLPGGASDLLRGFLLLAWGFVDMCAGSTGTERSAVLQAMALSIATEPHD